MKSGMSHDGREITGVEYLRQRIQDVFKTPLGTIPLARGFGSKHHQLIDENVTPNFYMSAYENTAEAFLNPDNDLDDAEFISMDIDSQDDIVTFTVRVKFNNNTVKLSGLTYE